MLAGPCASDTVLPSRFLPPVWLPLGCRSRPPEDDRFPTADENICAAKSFSTLTKFTRQSHHFEPSFYDRSRNTLWACFFQRPTYTPCMHIKIWIHSLNVEKKKIHPHTYSHTYHLHHTTTATQTTHIYTHMYAHMHAYNPHTWALEVVCPQTAGLPYLSSWWRKPVQVMAPVADTPPERLAGSWNE